MDKFEGWCRRAPLFGDWLDGDEPTGAVVRVGTMKFGLTSAQAQRVVYELYQAHHNPVNRWGEVRQAVAGFRGQG
jgi:hypothetical protein